MALCPAHDDHNPSLSIKETSEGKVLLHCFAGCSFEAILGALGLGGSTSNAGLTLVKGYHPPNHGASVAQKPRDIVATYRYEDEEGNLLFEVVRCKDKDGKKSFYQRRPDPDNPDKRIYNMKGVRWVLYHLPDIIKAKQAGQTIYLVEGEKDADNLNRRDLIATTSPMGSGNWRKEYAETLRGADVVIIPDNDDPGRAYAERAANSLYGVAARVRMIMLSDLPEKGDVSDWLEAGHSKKDLEDLLGQTSDWKPAEPQDSPTSQDTAQDIFNSFKLMLPEQPSIDDTTTALKHLHLVDNIKQNKLSPLKVEGLRVKIKEFLRDRKVPGYARLVDTAFSVVKEETVNGGQVGNKVTFPDIEPWHEPIIGTELTECMVRTLRKYVSLSDDSAVLVTSWILSSHTYKTFDTCPILALYSPEKRCGKTTLLGCIYHLVPRALMAANITPAAIYRTIEKYSPTLLIDEADTFITKKDANPEIRGILNSGHTRDACVIRTEGDDHEPVQFSTYCPKAIALIGKLPDTLEDRSIVIPMKRKTDAEEIIDSTYRERMDDLRQVHSKIIRWVQDNLSAIESIRKPSIPSGIKSDRLKDNIRPLLAIAEAVGGEWLDKVHRAVLSLCEQEPEDTYPLRALRDVYSIFENHGVEKLSSADIIQALVADEEGPWGEYTHGRPLTARGLAKLLVRYGIKPSTIRLDVGTAKGYSREQFSDAWDRYLPQKDIPISETPKNPIPIRNIRNKSIISSTYATNPSVTSASNVTDKNDKKFNDINDVSDVTDKNGGCREWMDTTPKISGTTTQTGEDNPMGDIDNNRPEENKDTVQTDSDGVKEKVDVKDSDNPSQQPNDGVKVWDHGPLKGKTMSPEYLDYCGEVF
jgi:putative DNA primase/helicase